MPSDAERRHAASVLAKYLGTPEGAAMRKIQERNLRSEGYAGPLRYVAVVFSEGVEEEMARIPAESADHSIVALFEGDTPVLFLHADLTSGRIDQIPLPGETPRDYVDRAGLQDLVMS